MFAVDGYRCIRGVVMAIAGGFICDAKRFRRVETHCNRLENVVRLHQWWFEIWWMCVLMHGLNYVLKQTKEWRAFGGRTKKWRVVGLLFALWVSNVHCQSFIPNLDNEWFCHCLGPISRNGTTWAKVDFRLMSELNYPRFALAAVIHLSVHSLLLFTKAFVLNFLKDDLNETMTNWQWWAPFNFPGTM